MTLDDLKKSERDAILAVQRKNLALFLDLLAAKCDELRAALAQTERIGEGKRAWHLAGERAVETVRCAQELQIAVRRASGESGASDEDI